MIRGPIIDWTDRRSNHDHFDRLARESQAAIDTVNVARNALGYSLAQYLPDGKPGIVAGARKPRRNEPEGGSDQRERHHFSDSAKRALSLAERLTKELHQIVIEAERVAGPLDLPGEQVDKWDS